MFRSASRSSVLFWCVVAASVVLALLPAEHRARAAAVDLKHVAAFVVMGWLAAVAWPRDVGRSVVGLTLLGAAIEAVQLIPSLNRGASLGDLVCDAVGIALGVGMAAAVTGPLGNQPWLRVGAASGRLGI